MDGLIGGAIFNFIGACLRWCYFTIIQALKGEKRIPFRKIIQGENPDNDYDKIMNSLSNKAVGTIFIMSIVTIILWLNL